MKQTRRGFLKFLGKAAVVGVGFAAAPKAALAATAAEETDPLKIGIKWHEGLGKTKTLIERPRCHGRGPITATEVLDRRREFEKSAAEAFGRQIDMAFVRQYEKNVSELFRQRGSLLRIKQKRKIKWRKSPKLNFKNLWTS